MQYAVKTMTLEPDKQFKGMGKNIRVIEILDRKPPTELLPAWTITALVEYSESCERVKP